MSDVLRRICDDKRDHVARMKVARPLADIEAAAGAAPAPRGFAAALKAATRGNGFGLIAELKKASPSKGLIRTDFDPPSLAQAYELGGAACLSVLTDGPYFQGEDSFLVAARAAVNLPVLRKDFMIDPYQIFESRALGADCILLIMAALDDAEAADLAGIAASHGMDVLVEVHDEAELDRAAGIEHGVSLIGINNRNLKTLDVDLATTERLVPRMPVGMDVICESGIYGHADVLRMAKTGVRRFLVGESLMRQDDVAAATAALLGRPDTRRSASGD